MPKHARHLLKYAQKSIEQYRKEKSSYDSWNIKIRDLVPDKTLFQLADKIPENNLTIPCDEQDSPSFVFEEW